MLYIACVQYMYYNYMYMYYYCMIMHVWESLLSVFLCVYLNLLLLSSSLTSLSVLVDLLCFLFLATGDSYLSLLLSGGDLCLLSCDLLGDPRDLSANLRDLSGDFRDRSGDLRDLSGDLRDRSGDLLDLSGDLFDLSSDLRERSGDLRDRSGDLRCPHVLRGDLRVWACDLMGDLRDLSGERRVTCDLSSSDLRVFSTDLSRDL